MGKLKIKDADGTNRWLNKRGLGTEASPFLEELDSVKTIDSVLKTASMSTIGDYKQLTQKDAVLFDEQIGGGATSVYESSNGGVKMECYNTGDFVIRQTRVSHSYVSGNPQVFEQTTIDMSPVSGYEKCIGYFSSNTVGDFSTNYDGFILVSEGTGLFLKVMKGGTAVLEAAQTSWDDPMDGTGASGITLDPSKFQALVGEFLYLGGTVFRAGFLIGAEVIWVHTFKNTNITASTFVRSPNQPLRWEIRNISAGAVTASMYHVCGKVGTLGSMASKGISRFHSSDEIFINTNVIGTKYAVLGIKGINKNTTINISAMTGMALTTDKFLMELVMNPVVSGTFNYVDDVQHQHSIAMGATDGSNIISSAEAILAGEYITSSGSGSIVVNNLLRMGSKIDGTFDSMVVCITPLGANLDVVAGITVSIEA